MLVRQYCVVHLRKSERRAKARQKALSAASSWVTVSPKTHSVCPYSFPAKYRTAATAPVYFLSPIFPLLMMPQMKMHGILPALCQLMTRHEKWSLLSMQPRCVWTETCPLQVGASGKRVGKGCCFRMSSGTCSARDLRAVFAWLWAGVESGRSLSDMVDHLPPSHLRVWLASGMCSSHRAELAVSDSRQTFRGRILRR